jgi:signal transduction histidine kinase
MTEPAPDPTCAAWLAAVIARAAEDAGIGMGGIGGAESKTLFSTQAERSLAASEEQLVEVMDGFPGEVFISRDGVLLYANRALRRLLRLEEDALAEPPPCGIVLDEQRAGCLAGAGDLNLTAEITLVSPTHTVTLEVRSVPAMFGGRPATLSFGRDLTEQKHVEAQLMQADRLAALGTLAGGLAHAINNPLSSVMLNLEDLVRRMPELPERPGLARQVEERLVLAKEAADRVASVVAQLRVFSRMRRTEAARNVDVRRVLEEVIELVANEIRHRGQLETSLQPVPPVVGVEGRIEQALLTLLIFAVRKLPERAGGHARLIVGTRFVEGRVEIALRCEGAPMTQRLAEQTTDPFAGADIKDPAIGLAICADIVRSIGGELGVGGDPTSSSFHVHLPSEGWETAEGRARLASVHPLHDEGSARARILVIDDDPGVLGALRLMLQEQHDVTVTQDPHGAVRELAAGASYDIVFSDFVMPGMTGEEVYEAVKRVRPGFEGRIVFMTGAAFQQEAEQFLGRIQNARVDKPFNLEQIERLVRSRMLSRE